MNEFGLSITDSSGHILTIKEVKDSYNFSHVITKELGKGGQGVVCKTENPELVLKFILNKENHVIRKDKNKELFNKYLQKIKGILTKPFPHQLHLAIPMAYLQDFSGYVMRMMGEMICFQELFRIDIFPETGGHRRRFEFLSRLASLLARIHGRGMVYCDISPNNVFISAIPDIKPQNVWLIDSDNIFIPGFDDAHSVYTPRYAAPELFEGKPCSQSSDAYSFAVLAFECLAILHPFEGKKTTNWEDEDIDAWDTTNSLSTTKSVPEIDTRYSGKHPWVEDPEDDSNHTEAGFPRQYFLSEETFSLFNTTFTIGKADTSRRPAMVLWARAFAQSFDRSVKCNQCGMSFIYEEGSVDCPWCQETIAPRLVFKSKGQIIFIRELDSTKEEWIQLPERLFTPFHINTNWKPVLEFQSGKNCIESIKFKTISSITENFYIHFSNAKRTKIKGQYELVFKANETYSLEYEPLGGGSTKKLDFEIIGEKQDDY